MTDSKCSNCASPCSMDANDSHGWFCNCVYPCPHADRGEGWYITSRREQVIEVVDAIYYVWADNPKDAINKLDHSTTYRTERAIRSREKRIVQPLSGWTPAAYDFNEGMGR